MRRVEGGRVVLWLLGTLMNSTKPNVLINQKHVNLSKMFADTICGSPCQTTEFLFSSRFSYEVITGISHKVPS